MWEIWVYPEYRHLNISLNSKQVNSSHKPTFFQGIATLTISPKILMLFSEILTHTSVGLIQKGLLFPRKTFVCGWNVPYWFEIFLPKASKQKETYFAAWKIH